MKMILGMMEGENENAKIFLRILPSSRVCDCLVKIGENKKDIYIRCMQDMKRDKFVKTQSPLYWQFQTDGIFYNNSQDEVYEGVTQDLLNNILDGANCVIVSYGQTGTGKSFTTAGLRNSYEHRGMIVRLLSDLFKEKLNRKYSNDIEYRLSYVEIFLNKIKDLLVKKNNNRREKLNIRDAIKNVTSVILTNEDEALKKIFEGEARKKIEQGDTYDGSHQGTSILTFHVSNKSLTTSWAVKTRSKIHIVDMAGADSFDKKNCRKIRNANLDKAQMEQFIINLQKFNESSIIHRHSNNLLKYLGNEFNLGSLLRFVAHIRTTEEDLVLTLSILRFGNNVKKLKAKKIHREFAELEKSLEIKKLRENVAMLKKELEMNEMLLNQEPLENISTIREKQIEKDAIDFINGSLDDLTLLSISQAKILLKTFKNMFKKLEEDREIALKQATRDTNDSIAKDLKGSSLSITKSSKTAITISNSKMKRKKSIAVDNLPKLTSQVSLNDDETTKKKYGEIIDSGQRMIRIISVRITIGPSRLESAAGPVMKLVNNNRYEELQYRSKNLFSELIEPAEINSKVMDDDTLMLKRDAKKKERERKIGEEMIKELIIKYKDIKTELEKSLIELHNNQNVRHLNGNEIYDDEGRVIIPELERKWFCIVKGLEEDLTNVECQIHQAEENLKKLIDDELNAIYKFQSTFKMSFEKLDDRLVIPINTVNLSNDNDDDDDDDTRIEWTNNDIEKMKLKFIQMQDIMKLTIEKNFNRKTAVKQTRENN